MYFSVAVAVIDRATNIVVRDRRRKPRITVRLEPDRAADAAFCRPVRGNRVRPSPQGNAVASSPPATARCGSVERRWFLLSRAVLKRRSRSGRRRTSLFCISPRRALALFRADAARNRNADRSRSPPVIKRKVYDCPLLTIGHAVRHDRKPLPVPQASRLLVRSSSEYGYQRRSRPATLTPLPINADRSAPPGPFVRNRPSLLAARMRITDRPPPCGSLSRAAP